MINIKYKSLFTAIVFILIIILNPITVYANSSWHWVTTSPMTVLPFAIIITLLIETMSIVKFNNLRNIKKVFVIVSLANILSFFAPYVERAYRFIPTTGGYSILSAFNKGPYYIVLIGYLFLTIIIELPTVFLFLKKEVSNRKKLMLTIVISNITTTSIVAICERLICVGKW